jgi:hypothetical protein
MIMATTVLTGCPPKYGPHNVALNLDSGLKENNQWRSVEVDLVGVGDHERAQWESKSIDEYFSSGDSLRADAKANGQAQTLRFSSADAAKTLARNDPIWKNWKAKQNMFVIADLRWYSDADDAKGLHRRLIVPIDTSRWESGQTIEIAVRRAGLQYKTEPKPEAK